MSNDVIDFVCLRIQSEINRYIKTRTLPHDLLDGTYNVDDINKCKDTFDSKQQKAADKLIAEYTKNVENNLAGLKTALRKDYSKTMETLRTTHTDFMLPSVLVKYRAGINPVTALYYEIREMLNRYNSSNEYHVWLLELIRDNEYNNRIIDALSTDIKKLERIIKRYYWPLVKLDDNIPLELFHAKQLIKDFRHYISVLNNIKDWAPDE